MTRILERKSGLVFDWNGLCRGRIANRSGVGTRDDSRIPAMKVGALIGLGRRRHSRCETYVKFSSILDALSWQKQASCK